jgi:superfamily I DNA/RNA helicase
MKWNNRGGHVETLRKLHVENIPDGSAFICRCNAPLFSLALRFLTAGRGCRLVGTDLGPNLLRTLKKLGPESLTKKETLHAIAQWEAERLLKAKDKASINDKAECLRVFANFGNTLGGAIAYAEHIFKGQGAIELLSGHKAKGLEWDTVYHLDPWRIPSPYAETKEEIEQELNLNYVITTRAKRSLYFVDLADIEANHGSKALLRV